MKRNVAPPSLVSCAERPTHSENGGEDLQDPSCGVEGRQDLWEWKWSAYRVETGMHGKRSWVAERLNADGRPPSQHSSPDRLSNAVRFSNE